MIGLANSGQLTYLKRALNLPFVRNWKIYAIVVFID